MRPLIRSFPFLMFGLCVLVWALAMWSAVQYPLATNPATLPLLVFFQTVFWWIWALVMFVTAPTTGDFWPSPRSVKFQ